MRGAIVVRVIADSVRLALPTEAPQLAALQRRAWVDQLPAAMAEPMLASVDLDAMTQAWAGAIARPPLARFRVLVAVNAERVVGFAALGPSDDDDAEPGDDGLIAEFTIDPAARRLGHGSRLLHACVDTLRADGFTRATWWVRAADDALRHFLDGTGWSPDGAHREIGTDDGHTTVKQVRLHTDISTGSSGARDEQKGRGDE